MIVYACKIAASQLLINRMYRKPFLSTNKDARWYDHIKNNNNNKQSLSDYQDTVGYGNLISIIDCRRYKLEQELAAKSWMIRWEELDGEERAKVRQARLR